MGVASGQPFYMVIFHYFFVGLGVLVLLLALARGWLRSYPAAVLYIGTVALGDLFFAVVVPLAGIDQTGWTYYYAYYLLTLLQHLCKLAVAIGLYRHFLAGCPNLKAITDIFLYATLVLAALLFLFSLDPRGSFLYLAAIHLGRWVYLMLAVVCVGVLALARVTRKPLDEPYRLIILAFLVLSLPQALSFTLLAQFYAPFSVFWSWTGVLSMNLATCLWGWAALKKTVPTSGDSDSFIGRELSGLLVRLDLQTGLVLRRLRPLGRAE